MMKFIVLLFFFSHSGTLSAQVFSTATSGPQKNILEFWNQIRRVSHLENQEKYNQFRKLVEAYFNIHTMGIWTLGGKRWRQMSKAQRTEFLNVFSDYSLLYIFPLLERYVLEGRFYILGNSKKKNYYTIDSKYFSNNDRHGQNFSDHEINPGENLSWILVSPSHKIVNIRTSRGGMVGGLNSEFVAIIKKKESIQGLIEELKEHVKALKQELGLLSMTVW